MSIIDVIGTPVAQVLKGIHAGITALGVPSDSGWAWGTSIVLLVCFVRILLFPLFVKQIRSQRRMQELAPQVSELKKKHKGDRETLNREMMELYKANNANPISGCLPILLQIPVFFALFSVLREFKPNADGRFGLSASLLQEGASAQIINAPIAAALNDSTSFITDLGGNSTGTRIIALVMMITMGLTTFLTQKQMMNRAAATDPTQLQIQRIMLYVLPIGLAVFGFAFPIGVLLYWLTTNLWSLGQQQWVIRRMPPPNLKPKGYKPGKGGNDGKGGSDGKGGTSTSGTVSLGKNAENGAAGSGSSTSAQPLSRKDRKRLAASGAPAGQSSGSSPSSGGSSGGASGVDILKAGQAPAPSPGSAKTASGRPKPSGRSSGSRRNKKRKHGR